MQSQNHRMVEVGRHFWRSSGPNPLLKQGHLLLVAQDHVWMVLWYLQGAESTASLDYLFQNSVTLTVKKYFLTFRSSILCLLPLILSLGTTAKSLPSSCLHLPFVYLDILIWSPLSLFFAMLKSPSSLSLSLYVRCSSPFIISAAIHWTSQNVEKRQNFCWRKCWHLYMPQRKRKTRFSKEMST